MLYDLAQDVEGAVNVLWEDCGLVDHVFAGALSHDVSADALEGFCEVSGGEVPRGLGEVIGE